MKPEILLLDNYDSFTYNLVEYFRILGQEPRVVRNDEYTVEEMLRHRFDALVVSPGPGRPEDSGILLPFLKEIYGKRPMLGICLGMQALGLLNGALLHKSPEPVHGKTSEIFHQGTGLFKGLPSPFQACRYHSLILDESVNNGVSITAKTADGIVMALEIPEKMAWGVQFHPEAILTNHGYKILENWLEMAAHSSEQKI